jgi:hypothetical protein
MTDKSGSREFEDPKIILTTSLLRQKDNIATMINAGAHSNALIAMATLITQLDINPTETKLLEARKALVENMMFSKIPSKDTISYFQLINDYLNATYFADYHKAKPKVSTVGKI